MCTMIFRFVDAVHLVFVDCVSKDEVYESTNCESEEVTHTTTRTRVLVGTGARLTSTGPRKVNSGRALADNCLVSALAHWHGPGVFCVIGTELTLV